MDICVGCLRANDEAPQKIGNLMKIGNNYSKKSNELENENQKFCVCVRVCFV